MSLERSSRNARPERVFVARHPRCPNVRFGDLQVAELRDNGYRVAVMDTEPTYGATEEKFHKQRRPGDVHLVIGGEGTTNRMYRIVKNLPLDERNITTIGGGNACDIHNMLSPGKRALEVLDVGRYTMMRALEMEVTDLDSDDGSLYEALAYAGVGGTARSSHNIDWSKRFSNRFTRRSGIQRGLEAAVAWAGVATHPDFRVTMDDGTPPFLASDFSAFNGDRMAVYGKPHADMFDTENFTALFSQSSGMARSLIEMLKMQQGKSADRPYKEPLGFSIELDEEQLTRPLYVHVDGESGRIPPRSHVVVGMADDPYFTYSTRAAGLEAA